MIEKGGEPGLRRQALHLRHGPHGHRLRPDRDHPREQGQTMRGKAGAHWAISFEEFKKKLEPYTAST